MKKRLTLKALQEVAKLFCQTESGVFYPELYGINDGKAIGTFVEHRFQGILSQSYSMPTGNSAHGLDLPSINTDIKVTSITQPQSSCPYRDSRQKVYGLGYNLIVFVYRKEDDSLHKKSALHYVSCTYIDHSRTADYQLTNSLLATIKNHGNIDDIFALLCDRQLPGDEITLMRLAEDIMHTPPQQGYLTISNALQWRLQYNRVVHIDEPVQGIETIIKYAG